MAPEVARAPSGVTCEPSHSHTHTHTLSHDTMGTHTPASRAGLLRDRPRRELLHGAARRGACSKCLPPARVVAVTRSLALD